MGERTERGVVGVLWTLAVLGALAMMVGSLSPWPELVIETGFLAAVVCTALLTAWVLRP